MPLPSRVKELTDSDEVINNSTSPLTIVGLVDNLIVISNDVEEDDDEDSDRDSAGI